MNALRDWYHRLVAIIARHLAFAQTHPKAAAILAGLLIFAVIVLPPYPFP